ncbi:hypothetical protein L1987_62449 [Smallanthus sonchifolius]|uniref:Uncharacterized protein n=1 Tax=Smallanthus sonchifolius TaxID=185202 RepID=A0ACB9CAH0_9ASTR|nr:hypothetical protein L1987_62449 [Smallanthus sonchifolius]
MKACSLAAHWGLGKLIAFYDDNHTSIDGSTDIAFTENVDKRFEGLGWHVIWVKNGNSGYDEIREAIEEQGIGADTFLKEMFLKTSGMKSLQHMRTSTRKIPWNWKALISGELPVGWEKALPTYTPETLGDATRNLSQQCLNALAKVLPGLLGGSADLASSNMTLLKMFSDLQKETPEERNIRFGVREHGIGAICNGITHHTKGLIPYCATFFVFTDYMRPAIRLAALSESRVIYVMTHDSIGLGEDGPTHQPVEHIASFRAMPNILMLRPADGNETAGAYRVAILNTKRPSVD